jgi:hypothetical protein
MRTRFVLSTLLIAAAAAAVLGQPVDAPPTPHDAGFAQALEQFRGGRHAAAYARLTRLADAGHGPSAQLALLMLRHGKLMFGAEWSASAGQQLRWHAHAVDGSRGALPLVDNDAGD